MAEKYPYKSGSFTADFDSLYHFRCPEWYRDAKFGIWSHWGPQSVPMYGDWYARNMYIEGSEQYLHHLRCYGHPSETGYLDLVKQWKAEAFDPDELIGLYKKAGAVYFVAQAMHHDNFFNFDSKENRFNSVNMGPHRDIVGAWKQAAEGAGLIFGLSEHHGASFEWMNTNKLCDTKGPYVGVPYDGNNPEYTDFYHDNKFTTEPGYVWHHYTWHDAWYPKWYRAVQEAVDKYQPQLLYSDGALPFFRNYAGRNDSTYLPGLSMAAHLYNSSEARYGKNESVYLHKDRREEYWRIGLLDFERSMENEIRSEPWQTDTCLGHWFYDVRAQYKSARQITDLLTDVVSKNGNLLLNIPQRPDGTIDAECRYILAQIADWTAVCGEGIYGTRPYEVCGEGPTTANAEKETVWTPYDIRYTRRGNTVYAFLMGAADSVLLRRLRNPELVKNVTLLGFGEVPFTAESGKLSVGLPDRLPTAFSNCLKLEY